MVLTALGTGAGSLLVTVVATLVTAGIPLRAISAALAGAGKTTKNGEPLSPTQVKRLMERLNLARERG